MVRGVVNLPNGSGRTRAGRRIRPRRQGGGSEGRGCRIVGAEDLVEKVQAARSILIAASPRPT